MKRKLSFVFTALILLAMAGMASATTWDVSISNYAFSPADLTINVGDTVRWTNHDTAPHTVSALDNSFDSGYLATNSIYTHAFTGAGSNAYHCQYHPSMTANVTVQTAGGGHTDRFHEVAISGFAFQPASLAIAVGDTVQWTNNDGASHTVTASDGSFDSGNLSSGAMFMFVFSAAGDFAYACQYHPSMTGTIQVAQSAELYEVTISGFAFHPAELNIEVGDTVRWTNNDTAPHTATADGGAFNSGTLTQGQTFTFVFTAEGSYPYHCAIHSTMTGVINVGEVVGNPEWVEQTSPTSLPLNDVRFWDDNLGWAGGEQGILYTNSRGGSWTLVPTTAEIEGLYFVSATEGWACGYGGLVLHSTDGGQSWQDQTSGVTVDLYDVWFADASNGWVVGEDGTLLHTVDGGQNWFPQANPEAGDLLGIQMLDAQRGWAVGDSGLVLNTTDGGASWNTQFSASNGAGDEFESVYALDENHAWVCGGQGRIYYTANGGQNWIQQATGTTATLTDISFPTSSSGWVVGSSGFLSEWDDSMQMWMTAPRPADTTLNAIYLVSPELGFLVAEDGGIYKYDETTTGVDPRGPASIPSRPELFANYPNPFNPSTNIQFQLSAAGNVKLAVLNVLGQQVATLIDGPMSAGLHEVQFSGSDFPSGLYFYQLRTGGQILSRRMILVK